MPGLSFSIRTSFFLCARSSSFRDTDLIKRGVILSAKSAKLLDLLKRRIEDDEGAEGEGEGEGEVPRRLESTLSLA